MHAIVLTNLSFRPDSVPPQPTLQKWESIMQGFRVTLVDTKGGAMSGARERSMNRMRHHTDLWERIANLEFGDGWVFVLEEDAKQLTIVPGHDLQNVSPPVSAGIVMLGSTQEYVSVSDIICQSHVEPLSNRSSALLEAPVLAYAITPEFAARMYGFNYANPIGVSPALVDMFRKMSRAPGTVQEPPRFYRLSCAAFGVASVHKIFHPPDSTTKVMGQDSTPTRLGWAIAAVPTEPNLEIKKGVSLREVKERFEEHAHKHDKLPESGYDSMRPAMKPIRMQAARPATRPALTEFAPYDTRVPYETNFPLRRYVSMVLVLCCALLVVGYALVRYFRRPVAVRYQTVAPSYTSFVPTKSIATSATTTSRPSIVPVI